MLKNKELIEINNKYREKYLNLAKEFQDETGLYIEGIHFGYPIGDSIKDEELFNHVNCRIDVTLF